MAPPLTTATAIDLSVIRPHSALISSACDVTGLIPDTRFRLLNTLQTSLDLEQILSMFRAELGLLINSSGMQYLNEAMNIQITLGNRDPHHCHYRLITQSEHLGEISFYREQRFNDTELQVIETLLGTLLSPVRNALQYRSALAASLTDALTGAGNRTALFSTLRREMNLARRSGMRLSVLVVDIDRFKSINDTYGHGVGDLVLGELVKVINKLNRSTDLCFRLGGEEFVVLLSNTDHGGANIVANRLCEAISNCSICTDDGAIQITVSIGVTTQCETDTEESLLNRADKAMYDVKRSGGNFVSWR